jgi:hypothetical protein
MKSRFTRRTLPSLLALGLVLLAGCRSGPTIRSDARPGFDFARLHTYELLPWAMIGNAGDPGARLRVEDAANRAIADALASRGFTAAPAGAADFTVSLWGESIRQVDVQHFGSSSRGLMSNGRSTMWHTSQPVVRISDRRTLTIEIFDNQTQQMVWTGWASANNRTRPVQAQEVTNAIHRILAGFPPAGAK